MIPVKVDTNGVYAVDTTLSQDNALSLTTPVTELVAMFRSDQTLTPGAPTYIAAASIAFVSALLGGRYVANKKNANEPLGAPFSWVAF